MRALLLVLAVGAAPDAGQVERFEVKKTGTLAALDELNGFQKATWGMSQREVRKLYPKAEAGAGHLMLRSTAISGLDARVTFFFDPALTKAVVSFADAQRGYATTDHVCDAVVEALKSKYGHATHSENRINGSQDSWWGKRTMFTLDCDRWAISPQTQVTLVYAQRSYIDAEHKVSSDDL